MFPAEQNPRCERVEFELRSSGVKPKQATNALRTGIHTRGYLPHVKRENASYFITFRLADSMPKEVLMKIQAERAEHLSQFHATQQIAKTRTITPAGFSSVVQIERDYYRKVEKYLDKGSGECWLKRPKVADLVRGALRFFEDQRYHLKAWVVIPTMSTLWFGPCLITRSALSSRAGNAIHPAKLINSLTAPARLSGKQSHTITGFGMMRNTPDAVDT